MKISFRTWIIFALALLTQVGTTGVVCAADDLAAGFRGPPKQARPSIYWLWLNGYVNRDHFEKELTAYKKKGISGLCLFEMGGRGPEGTVPGAGPAFFSEEFVDNIAHALEIAGRLDMDVQLATSSSWDMGGAWVEPHQASMRLYRSSMTLKGPRVFNGSVPMPHIAKGAPRDGEGKLLFMKNVAVLAVPAGRRQPAHEFVFKLPRGEIHKIDRVALYNTKSDDPKKYGKLHLFAREFSVSLSTTTGDADQFTEILRTQLEPHVEAQQFKFTPAKARYVRLRIYNGHNAKFDRVQLAEFEAYTVDGLNVAAAAEVDRTRDCAALVRFNSELNDDGKWAAANIHDGRKAGAHGSWSSAGPLPVTISDPSKIVNLTGKLSEDGSLQWDVPAGQWDILRFVCANTGERLKVPSPQSDGLATDHLSRQATRDYIEYLTTRLKAKLGDLSSTALKQLYLPSYEPEPEIWTPDFDAQFRKYKGYDIIPFLPALSGYVVKDQETTDRFMYDFRKALGELMIDAYYREASRAARDAGLGVEAEAGGPGTPLYQIPIDALKALGAIDEVRGEFWPWRPKRDVLWVIKETACAAHIYGKRRVHMESFTSMKHWENGPFDLKPSADRAFCEGMNHVVWHTASHQPPEAGQPGWVYHAGTHMGQNLIWWPKAKPFLDYLSSCSFMLQQGLFVADVCYYYGDQAFNFVPPRHVDPSLGPGYDYDVCNPEVILTRMDVKDGRISLPDGMGYELLVLPDRDDIDLAVLEKIGQLIRRGATVVGPRPLRSSGLHNYRRRDRQIAELAGRIWGDCDGKTITRNRYGKGQIIWGETLRSILQQRGFGADFSWESAGDEVELDYIHRRSGSSEIYFVRNKQNRAIKVRAHFRVRDKKPERWDPASGRISSFDDYSRTEQGTEVELSLAPYGSTFVVFRDEDTPGKTSVQSLDAKNRRTTSVAGPWQVLFPSGRGAPRSIEMDRLRSWTEHRNPGVRFYSGVARYKTEINISERMLRGDSPLILDLGDMWLLGEVFLNGRSLGILWKPPYEVDIKPFAKAGPNTLEIEVANTWANRLIGDAVQTGGKRYAKTNVTGSGTVRKQWKDMTPRRCGLFGPVTLNWE
ncbi:MAG: glycosyl hydrolase [Planctomycetota bacterium]|jgi:hypothetical protein